MFNYLLKDMRYLYKVFSNQIDLVGFKDIWDIYLIIYIYIYNNRIKKKKRSSVFKKQIKDIYDIFFFNKSETN